MASNSDQGCLQKGYPTSSKRQRVKSSKKMGFSKKTGKGRLDKYYFLAKEQGYRARSAFKLVQLHKKYNLLDQARVVIDLCAAPGGWLQVAAKYMPTSHVIVGVDLVPIKPISGVKTIVADITGEKCRSELKKELKTWKADLVLHDGAPNVGRAWIHDAYGQAELVLHSLKLATEFLVKDGAFVTKVFRSKDYNSLMWVFNQLFSKVEATKPASSRSVSAEIFVVCRGFKAPSFIDPRLLDPKHVFEEISLLQNAAGKTDLAHPEKKVRNRDGYEEGATMLFKKISIEEFINSAEPNNDLALYNQIAFPSDTASKIIELADSNPEIRVICGDLKVIGRREFKILSKWRKDARVKLGIDEKKEKVAVEEMSLDANKADGEDPLLELEGLSKRNEKLGKREKRKALERKAKQRIRMQLNMCNADDLAQDYAASESLFSLKKTSRHAIDSNADIVIKKENGDDYDDENTDSDQASNSDVNSDVLSDHDSIVTLSDDSEEMLWESELEGTSNPQENNLGADNSSDDDYDSDNNDASSDAHLTLTNTVNLEKSLLTKEEEKVELDSKTALWYSNPLFRELDASDVIPESSTKKMAKEKKRKAVAAQDEQSATNTKSTGKKAKKGPTPGEIIFVKADEEGDRDEDDDDENVDGLKKTVLTASGMTLAAKLAKDKDRAKKVLVDDSFNRYAFKDSAELPNWFKDDEHKHNKPQKPITKEGVALLKSKLRELDARPIKKEIEARGRNRRRVMQKLEQMKRKAAIIADSEDMGERQKSEQIQKMLAKAKKPQKKEKKFVIAKGSNRGIKGRPKGVKGHYKMVDSRMKKEIRAQKRIKRDNKKGKGKGKGRKH